LLAQLCTGKANTKVTKEKEEVTKRALRDLSVLPS
jgi:hypothetical protein